MIDLVEMLKGQHGGLSFSPGKGYSCSLMCESGEWVVAQEKTLRKTVEKALKLKKEKER